MQSESTLEHRGRVKTYEATKLASRIKPTTPVVAFVPSAATAELSVGTSILFIASR